MDLDRPQTRTVDSATLVGLSENPNHYDFCFTQSQAETSAGVVFACNLQCFVPNLSRTFPQVQKSSVSETP